VGWVFSAYVSVLAFQLRCFNKLWVEWVDYLQYL